MALVEKTVLVPHSAEQMFALVDRVEDYPQFLPWCGGASVDKQDGATVHATVQIDYHHIRQSFTTENVRTPPHQIAMTLQHGPFKQLDGSWRFIPLSPSACKIEFSLHYEFSSKLLEKMVGPVFHYIANNFVDAFIHRAEKVYPNELPDK
jgi:ribosome-associated toxin RatA of RatAB toxin-antitoxin module